MLELGAQILATLEPVEGHSGWAPDPIHGSTGAPGWRVGSIQISLGEPEGTCTLLLEEQRIVLIGEDPDEAVLPTPDDPRTVRLVATTNQLRRLGESAVGVVGGDARSALSAINPRTRVATSAQRPTVTTRPDPPLSSISMPGGEGSLRYPGSTAVVP